MNSVVKFDEVILVKELNEKLINIGQAYEVASIFDEKVVIRDAKTKVAVAAIKLNEFFEHFEKPEKVKGWTKWIPLKGFDGQNDVVYKTNRKKVIVKFIKDNVRAESCCHRDDKFDLYFGVQIAYLRCLNKALTKQKAEYEEKLREINHAIADNNDIVKSMVESLEG